MDYLDLEMSKYTSNYYKQDMLIFPWHKYSDLHEQIMYDFIRVYNDIQIIFAQEKEPMERRQLLTQISKAKVAFLPYDSPRIGKEIYECFLLGTIPLVPDIEGLRDLVPDEFRYPPEWTENIFNYSKFAPDLTSKIKDLIYAPTQKYEAIFNAMNNVESKEQLNNQYITLEELITTSAAASSMQPQQQPDPIDMKNELKLFMKKQFKENSTVEVDSSNSSIQYSTY